MNNIKQPLIKINRGDESIIEGNVTFHPGPFIETNDVKKTHVKGNIVLTDKTLTIIAALEKAEAAVRDSTLSEETKASFQTNVTDAIESAKASKFEVASQLLSSAVNAKELWPVVQPYLAPVFKFFMG